jgi:hypothetical protein
MIIQELPYERKFEQRHRRRDYFKRDYFKNDTKFTIAGFGGQMAENVWYPCGLA